MGQKLAKHLIRDGLTEILLQVLDGAQPADAVAASNMQAILMVTDSLPRVLPFPSIQTLIVNLLNIDEPRPIEQVHQVINVQLVNSDLLGALKKFD